MVKIKTAWMIFELKTLMRALGSRLACLGFAQALVVLSAHAVHVAPRGRIAASGHTSGRKSALLP